MKNFILATMVALASMSAGAKGDVKVKDAIMSDSVKIVIPVLIVKNDDDKAVLKAKEKILLEDMTKKHKTVAIKEKEAKP